jgi:hypothetical protein
MTVCPKAMRLVWPDALLNWLPEALLPPLSGIVAVASGKVCLSVCLSARLSVRAGAETRRDPGIPCSHASSFQWGRVRAVAGKAAPPRWGNSS